jgi:hypothetical protein
MKKWEVKSMDFVIDFPCARIHWPAAAGALIGLDYYMMREPPMPESFGSIILWSLRRNS